VRGSTSNDSSSGTTDDDDRRSIGDRGGEGGNKGMKPSRKEELPLAGRLQGMINNSNTIRQ